MSKSFDVQRATTQPVCSGMYFQTPEDLAAALSNVLCFHELAAELIAEEIFKPVRAICTCPSGDGSLRWPCPVHPPEVKPVSEPIAPAHLIAAINRLLDSDGSRGLYRAIQCGEAREELESLLASPQPAIPIRVKLPAAFNVNMGGDKSTRAMFQCMNMMREDCIKVLRAAGIEVEE